MCVCVCVFECVFSAIQCNLSASKLKFVIYFYNFYDAQSISVEHEAFQFTTCSDTEEEYFIGYDEEELLHVDFKRRKE